MMRTAKSLTWRIVFGSLGLGYVMWCCMTCILVKFQSCHEVGVLLWFYYDPSRSHTEPICHKINLWLQLEFSYQFSKLKLSNAVFLAYVYWYATWPAARRLYTKHLSFMQIYCKLSSDCPFVSCVQNEQVLLMHISTTQYTVHFTYFNLSGGSGLRGSRG